MNKDSRTIEVNIVDEEYLKHTKNKYYLGGRELKVGDKIIFGTTAQKSAFGLPDQSKQKLDEVNLAMQCFVYDKNNGVGMIHQLYGEEDE